ncbi:TauD/TfdA family dioxygenase [Laceyella tengchongensis]|jgi:hypothetical protein|uniref:TauD/TfdA family dioxygenase n=1 Tax=Laceyella tengchongensis TaxID=574699 RepID=UPI0012BA1E78|nr:hypothetical protein [Laceyella tengchongensis]
MDAWYTIISFIGSVFEKIDGGKIRLRFRADDLGYFSTQTALNLRKVLMEMDKFMFSIKLKKNQGYIINNGRWLHGRTEFLGSRKMMRILVESVNHRGFTPFNFQKKH